MTVNDDRKAHSWQLNAHHFPPSRAPLRIMGDEAMPVFAQVAQVDQVPPRRIKPGRASDQP